MLALTPWSFGTIAAALIAPVAANDAGFLALPLTKHTAPAHRLAERQTDDALVLSSDNGTFLIDVEIGNPKQKVQVALDIGSWATFVLETCDTIIVEWAEELCVAAGTYNYTASETFGWSEEEFYLNGGDDLDRQDGDSHDLSFHTDDFTIGGQETLKNISFGVDKFPMSMERGSLGLGFGRGVNTNGSANIMDYLVDQDIIASKSFGLTLGGNDTRAGSLILGGLDTKKFAGPLHKVPIADAPKWPFKFDEYRYYMEAEGVTFDDGAGNLTEAPGFTFMPQTIDEMSYLPNNVVATIAKAFGVRNTTSLDDEWYLIDCSWRDRVEGSLSLNFAGFSVSIPYREFVTQRDIVNRLEDECYISAIPRSERHQGTWYLGHSFLRSVYAVFDQDEKAVWLAQYQDCGSELVKFEGGSDVRGQCEGSGSNGSGSGNQDSDKGNDGAKAGMAAGAVVLAVVVSLLSA